MRLLAFDTATPATVVGLLTPDGARERRHDPAPGERPGHAAQLLPLASALLDEAGVAFAGIDRIVVGVGPGTFTGLRIGVATARALAQATGAELVGVSTLRALAAAVDDPGPVLAVLDARRGEAFAAVYDGDAVLSEPAAVTPAMLGDLVRPGRPAVGDGAVRFRDVLEPPGARVPEDGSRLHRVSALALAGLGLAAPVSGPGSVVPEYLRLPDAEIAFRERTQSPPS
jgi:tRNA threonylcarbamoyladenosine biosynthesis protein TsaB